jgi:hypothetical protein
MTFERITPMTPTNSTHNIDHILSQHSVMDAQGCVAMTEPQPKTLSNSSTIYNKRSKIDRQSFLFYLTNLIECVTL